MTILSKKKCSQGKSEVETTDQNPSHHGGSHSHQLSLGNLPNHTQQSEPLSHERLFSAAQTSPPRWPLNSSRDEKRPAHSSSPFDVELDSGPSKRRHRASPLSTGRLVRTKHRELRDHRERDLRDHRERNTSSPSNAVVGGAPTTTESTSPSGEADVSGYNSGDEYNSTTSKVTEEEWLEREVWFDKKLRKKGLKLKQMGEDGACLFRAVADQIYGDQDMHAVVRKHCMDYIASNADYFSQYVTEDFDTYISRKRLENVHGNHIEIQAMSEIYNRTVEVFCYTTEPSNIFHGVNKNSDDNVPIRLSYHRGVHYNSLIDPYKATVGVGLGLPGFHPGLAEKTLMKDAERQSEEFLIEQTMLEDKLKATDWEATNEAIEEQVARESYLQWLRDNEKRSQLLPPSASATCSSSSTSTASAAAATTSSHIASPRNNLNSRVSPRSSPKADNHRGSPNRVSPKPSIKIDASPVESVPGCSHTLSPNNLHRIADDDKNDPENFQLLETASFLHQLPPEMFGLTEWEDAGLLAQVLASSQQEYLDSLKRGISAEVLNSTTQDKINTSDSIDCPSTSYNIPSSSKS